MNIRDLEYLVALAEQRHFRKAAETCFVSQPTLSGQIKKLEEELGVSLLERTSRKVLFTDKGLELVDQAKNVLREVSLFTEMATKQGKSMSGPIHIGFIPTVGPYLLPWIVPVIRELYPDLELFFHEEQTNMLVKKLHEGKLDCLILAAVEETQAFIEIPLYNESMELAVPSNHQWATNQEIDMCELNGKTVLMLGDGHCLRDQALGFCFAAGAKDEHKFKATSLEALRNMVAADAGITLLPKLAVMQDRCGDNIRYLKAVNPTPSRSITLAYRPGSPLKSRYEKLAETIVDQMKILNIE
ncbi:DNA-binding transcriptional regulator OxyR [Vibrio sp. SS-MA-C1-2]|uniref:DNA-binding transcriptional regulator OxyR n=1 Tax=Vibrio sp. SS-MA-C1-2 TaxID=2908646 RepID=UPI001F3E7B4A|nr:DNA-binding transcriptional regulator OxyR [Vibrio sp. SS-MA-C1-2]UJF19227.1 DNA-binding transcriptional regulator OxyR [Vibrio sp. SS-MA-C1-2]